MDWLVTVDWPWFLELGVFVLCALVGGAITAAVAR
jgi:hypothetical protein